MFTQIWTYLPVATQSAGSELILLLSQALTFLGCSMLPWALLGCLLCTVPRAEWGRWAAWFPGLLLPQAPLHYGVTELLEVPDFPLLCRHYFLLFILIINWTSFYYYFKIFFGVLIQEKKPQMTYLLTVRYVYKFKSHHNLIISTWNYFMSFTKWNTSYSVMFRHS